MIMMSSWWISGSSNILRPSPWLPSSPSLDHSSRFRVFCKSQFDSKNLNLKLLLHDALDSSGNDTSHARAARDGFCSQIQNMSDIERETSIGTNKCVELGKIALYIAAEDDSLISHSAVPLPVDAFLERLNHLSSDFRPHYSLSNGSSPETLLESLEKYLYNVKGFRRTSASHPPGPNTFYLHSVLTRRCGSAAMLTLVYSEVLKMLQLWGVVDFDVEIYYPHSPLGLPRACEKKKAKESDQLHIMTSESLLVEILRNLKETNWPFEHGHTKSLFLGAADAANYIDSGFQNASAKAARHRLNRGVWTSALFGDMRRALSACERLIILGANWEDLREYAVLLYHCGHYDNALQYFKLYKESKQTSSLSNPAEDDALEKLIVRLNLILMDGGWRRPSNSFLHRNSEPW